jgi:cytochrome c oxidase assembly protein subunit 11
MNPQRRRNLKVVVPCLVFIGMMTGVVAYSPTLYRLFCAATGFGGTTQRVDTGSGAVSERTVTVRFDSNVAPDLPWRFEPVQREVIVHLGEQKLVFFTAENLSNKAIVGHAIIAYLEMRKSSRQTEHRSLAQSQSDPQQKE